MMWSPKSTAAKQLVKWSHENLADTICNVHKIDGWFIGRVIVSNSNIPGGGVLDSGVHLEKNYMEAESSACSKIIDLLSKIKVWEVPDKNSVSIINEMVQEQQNISERPKYEFIEDDDDTHFKCSITFKGISVTSKPQRTKKAAKQAAAQVWIWIYNGE